METVLASKCKAAASSHILVSPRRGPQWIKKIDPHMLEAGVNGPGPCLQPAGQTILVGFPKFPSSSEK